MEEVDNGAALELLLSGSQHLSSGGGRRIRVGDKDSHFSCDIVQSLPYCGPSLPQLLFDQHGTQKFKDHVGPIQQGQFLVEAWGT